MDTRILRTIAGMEADPAQRLAVTRVAAEVGLSRSRFEHLFKKSTGEGYKSRLRRLRLTRAKLLLADYRLSIKEICFRSGYPAPSSFSHDFKKLFGVSAAHFRHNTF